MYRMGWSDNSFLLASPKSSVLPLHNPALILTFKFAIYSAEGRTRTDTGVAPQQFLRLPRLPFRHFGALTPKALTPFKHSQ